MAQILIIIFEIGYTLVSLNAYETPIVSTIFQYAHFSIARSMVVDP